MVVFDLNLFIINPMKEKNDSKINCLGIMTGTSLDAIDYVLVEIDHANLSCRYISILSFPFPKALKLKLLKAAQHKLYVSELALLHHELGRFYASCFEKVSKKFQDIEVIGVHGQTVFHRGRVASLQIGEPSYLSAVSGGVVISDFRVGDIALGGQGSPLAAFFHNHVFGKLKQTISIHNLGGISNLSLSKNRVLIQGFDTGPANILIDMAIKLHTKEKKQYDKNGLLSRKGKVNEKLVTKMLTHKFFKTPPPKSCGREEFGEVFYNKYKNELHKLNINDRLATLTEFVAKSIALAYKKHVSEMPSEIIFCGGGANNSFLLERIAHHLPDIEIKTSADYGWPVQAIEGAAFALLAAARGLSLVSNIPESTGASRGTSLGKITQV